MGERETRAAYVKTMLEAKEALFQSLVRVSFQEPGHRGWLQVTGVTEHGVLVDNVDNPDEPTLVPWEKSDGLLRSIAATGLGERTGDGWERKTGGGFAYDWPYLVTISGWSYEDLQMRGISSCLRNRRKGGEESWVC